MRKLSLLATLIFTTLVMGQNEEKLPYYEIPEYPETYTAGTVAARMIDGLGFRYYWATEGLKEKDLVHKASESSRTSSEIIDHIYGLSKFIRNSILIDNKDKNKAKLDFAETRKKTLLNFKVVSDALRNTEHPIKLNDTKVPFWNTINGPIEDALWHCGQVVMLRRGSGNPFNSKVNLFKGQLED